MEYNYGFSAKASKKVQGTKSIISTEEKRKSKSASSEVLSQAQRCVLLLNVLQDPVFQHLDDDRFRVV